MAARTTSVCARFARRAGRSRRQVGQRRKGQKGRSGLGARRGACHGRSGERAVTHRRQQRGAPAQSGSRGRRERRHARGARDARSARQRALTTLGRFERRDYRNQPIFKLNVGSGVRPILSSVERDLVVVGLDVRGPAGSRAASRSRCWACWSVKSTLLGAIGSCAPTSMPIVKPEPKIFMKPICGGEHERAHRRLAIDQQRIRDVCLELRVHGLRGRGAELAVQRALDRRVADARAEEERASKRVQATVRRRTLGTRSWRRRRMRASRSGSSPR